MKLNIFFKIIDHSTHLKSLSLATEEREADSTA